MKRMWLMATLVTCGLMQSLSGGAAWAEDDGPTGAELLPKDTLLFLSVPDIPGSKDSFDKSLTGAMLQDPEFKPFLEDVKKKVEELSEKLKDELGLSIEDLMKIPEGEVTFALMERPSRKLAPVLMVDYGENSETVEKLLKKMHEGLEEHLEYTTEEVDDVKVHVFTLKEDDQDERNPYKSLVYVNEDSYLVFSTDVEAIKEVLARWDGKNDDTLANNDVYKYIQERCKDESGDPAMVWYVSPVGLVQAGLGMAAEISPEVALAGAFLPILGVDKLKGWGGASYSGAGDFDSISKSVVYADDSKGLLGIFQFPATDMTPPKWVAADVSMYFGANWNITLAYQSIEGLIDGLRGRGFTAKQLDRAANAEPGIHPKKDVIDLLDGKIHMVQGLEVEEDEPPIQKMLLALGVKDAAKAKKTLAILGKWDALPLETREFNGETIYEFSPAPEFTLSLTVANGHFVVTNDTAALEGMLRTGSGASLVESPSYQKIAKHFPPKVSLLSYSNSSSQFKALYQTLKNLENQEFLEGIDLQKLPSFEVIQKYLRPSGSYTIPDKRGSLTVGFQLREGDK